MRILRASRFFLSLLFLPLLPTVAQPSDNIIRVALIEDFSGARQERGNQVRALFDNYARTTNNGGGLAVGPRTYEIQLITYDAGSKVDMAAVQMARAAEFDKATVVVCSYYVCASKAEETKTPLILTASSVVLSKGNSNTFLIRAPSQDDSIKQAGLAVKALHQALVRSVEPTSEKITATLRRLDFSSELGSVRFDESGNNVGLVAYPFRPDAAGCTSSCGSTCPSNCGQTSCTKTGGNECCSICGMPRPN
jgi:ABC-type branched-subunit amino acid transport system substrate-binding protein